MDSKDWIAAAVAAALLPWPIALLAMAGWLLIRKLWPNDALSQ